MRIAIVVGAILVALPAVGLAYYQFAHVRPYRGVARRIIAEAHPEDRNLSVDARVALIDRLEPGLRRYPVWLAVLLLGRRREITEVATRFTLLDIAATERPTRMTQWHARQALWLITFPPLLSREELVTLYCHHRRIRDHVTCGDLLT